MSNLDSITPEYLLSEQYIKDMMTGYTDSYDTFISGIYDAEPKTQNYNIRHFPLVNQLGGWRWKGIFTYRETFIDLIFNKNLRGVDFGGSQRPIASHVDVVDIEDTDFYGRPVKYKTLEEVDYDLDFIFTSHTLEHIPDLDQTLTSMYDNLTKDGILAINIPSHTVKRWWANTGNWMGGTPHVHSFKLSKTNAPYYTHAGTQRYESIPNLIDIDTLLEKKGFNIALAEYSGDNNIIIFAEK